MIQLYKAYKFEINADSVCVPFDRDEGDYYRSIIVFDTDRTEIDILLLNDEDKQIKLDKRQSKLIMKEVFEYKDWSKN